MRCDWNPDKHERNQRERGFGFDFATLIFEGGTVEWLGDQQDYGEVRVRAIGEADGFGALRRAHRPGRRVPDHLGPAGQQEGT